MFMKYEKTMFNMKKSILILLTVIFTSIFSFGQKANEVIIPNFNDKYSEYIKKIESGQTEVDYKDFRFSFIESEQFKVAYKQHAVFDSLKKEMYLQMSKKNYQEIINITKGMLSIDYTSMLAHKILQQTYKITGDTVNKKKYHDIEFGLLNSIVKNGDGKTCETAWPVIQIEEEYFILDILGAELQKQSIENNKGLCDKMAVKVDGEKKTYYFETSKVFEGYNKFLK